MRPITPGRDRLRQNRRLLAWSLTALPLLLLLASRHPDDQLMWLVAGGISFGAFSISPARRSGYAGEEKVVDCLVRTLPESYVIMNQIEVPNPRSRTGTTEIDAVVVGPTGVYTVEVKNNKGEILGTNEHAPEWPVRKIGQRGNTYQGAMRNPIRQAIGQAMTLKRYLSECGISVWINPMVVKANPESVWRVGQTRGVPVVAAENVGLQCRMAAGKARGLAPAEVEAITNALYALKSRG